MSVKRSTPTWTPGKLPKNVTPAPLDNNLNFSPSAPRKILDSNRLPPTNDAAAAARKSALDYAERMNRKRRKS